MDSGSPGFRHKPSDVILDILSDYSHQIRELIHDEDNVRHLLCGIAEFLYPGVEVLNVPDTGLREDLVASLHLINEPGEHLQNAFRLCDDRSKQMRNTVVDIKLDNLRVNHDQAHILRPFRIKD